jgi:hypothetical protein
MRRTMRQAAREYIRQRVTGRREELRRESDAEIREAIRQSNAQFWQGGMDNA